jgi:hypothetical protein
MKIRFYLTFAALWVANVSTFVAAQKHDYYMTLGYSSNTTTKKFGGTDIDFNTWPPDTSYVFRDMDFRYNAAAICDEQGNLLFYTNGCSINGPDHEEILNGDSLNPGLIHNNFCDSYGYTAEQGSNFIPHPTDSDLYYLFHLGLNIYDSIGGVGDRFYYSLLDKTLDNGHGGVVLKNQVLLEDTLAVGQITMTKHANGRDWWIVVPEMSTPKHYIFRLTPNGILGPKTQVIGNIQFDDDGVGNAVFSPDGTKYARYDWYNQLNYFDFDRCTGTFSNPQHFSVLQPTDTFPEGGGVAFSPDSRYLYLSTFYEVFQYDTWPPDLKASEQLIATFDGGLILNSYTFFFIPQLGPDGRMYICSASAVPIMHLIEWPNRPGTAANVIQRGFPLPTYNARAMCFFPNYRLGPIDGSPCDTLGYNNYPLANFRWDTEDTLNQLKITFTDLSAYEPTTWLWDFGDGQTSQDTSPVHVYASPDIYNVCLTVSNINGTHTECKTLYIGVSAVENPPIENPVKVLPNPFSEQLQITIAEGIKKPVFRLYNQLGILITEQSLATGGPTIETDGILPGIYFWELLALGERIGTGKVFKFIE